MVVVAPVAFPRPELKAAESLDSFAESRAAVAESKSDYHSVPLVEVVPAPVVAGSARKLSGFVIHVHDQQAINC